MSYKKVLEDLPKLSAAELKAVKVRVDFLLRLATTKPDHTATDSSLIENLILLQAERFVEVPTLFSIKHFNPYKVNDKLINISSQISEFSSELELTSKHLPGLVHIVIDCANARMKEYFKTSSFNLLLNCIPSVKMLLEMSFPGYLRTPFFKDILATRAKQN